MSVARLLVLVMVCSGICAQAQSHSLAVYAQQSSALDDIAVHSLKVELQRLLTPAGVNVFWRDNSSEQPQDDVERLVVGKFEGSCDVENVVQPPSADSATAYAETVVSNGKIIPYFTVDCARILRALTPTFRPMSVPMRQGLLGRAVARVMAHEIYHVLAATSVHEKTGVTKSSLSAEDLIADKLDFNRSSLLQIRTGYSPRPPQVPGVASLVPVR